MKNKLFLLSIVFLIAGCTSPESATRALQNSGYTDIHITGYRFLSCSEDDTFRTGFVATNIASGKQVQGTVCSGFLKGATIRLD